MGRGGAKDQSSGSFQALEEGPKNGGDGGEEKGVLDDGFGPYVTKSLYELLFTSWMNVLMLFTPFAVMAYQGGWADGLIFGFSLLAIAPFAERLSFVTEQLAMHTSETFGGLLNATFGNVTELIVSLFALKVGMLRIVQVSLLGSILSNLLLVLGCAFLAGGVKFPQQTFSKTMATISSALLLFGCMSILFPNVLELTGEQMEADSSLLLSRVIACAMLAMYCFYLIFQLGTHRHLFDPEPAADGEEEEEEEEEKILGAWGAIFWLAVITVAISFLSKYMVDALQGAAKGWGVPDLFLGTIIIPIVGNAAEHAAAIIFAMKNKMELSLGIAVGSAVQIAIFVLPLCIVIGWYVDVPLSLDLHAFESVCLLISVLLVTILIQSGESNWL
jgi:Ca2+:H+ antiporter